MSAKAGFGKEEAGGTCRCSQPLRQGKGTASKEAWPCPAAVRLALVEQMAMGRCNAIRATWAQAKKGFQLVEEAQKSGILIPKSCPAPFAPEKHCPVICLVRPYNKGRMFSSISGFSLDTGESHSWSEG